MKRGVPENACGVVLTHVFRVAPLQNEIDLKKDNSKWRAKQTVRKMLRNVPK